MRIFAIKRSLILFGKDQLYTLWSSVSPLLLLLRSVTHVMHVHYSIPIKLHITLSRYYVEDPHLLGARLVD